MRIRDDASDRAGAAQAAMSPERDTANRADHSNPQHLAAHYRRVDGVSLIEIKLANLQQLFNTFDPSPFREKDLDPDAEEYIVDAVRELPLHTPVKLVFHLPPEHMPAASALNLTTSIHNYFDYRLQTARRDLRFLLHQGRISLVIGLGFLAGCLLLRQLLLGAGGALQHVIAESLLIAGWVAMWRPIEIFLYDWWPLRGMGRVYAKLARIPVDLIISTPTTDQAPLSARAH